MNIVGRKVVEVFVRYKDIIGLRFIAVQFKRVKIYVYLTVAD